VKIEGLEGQQFDKERIEGGIGEGFMAAYVGLE
jgi:hypothetical protein